MNCHVGIKSGKITNLSFIGWIIKRDSEGNFNICLPFIDGIYIHTIYGASVFWHGFIKATKVHKCFWFGFPPRQPNIFGWVFLLRWIFYPIVLSHICRQCGTAGLGIIFRNVFEEWRSVRFSLSLLKLCTIFVFVSSWTCSSEMCTKCRNYIKKLCKWELANNLELKRIVCLVDFIFCVFSNVCNNVRFMAHHTS